MLLLPYVYTEEAHYTILEEVQKEQMKRRNKNKTNYAYGIINKTHSVYDSRKLASPAAAPYAANDFHPCIFYQLCIMLAKHRRVFIANPLFSLLLLALVGRESDAAVCL